MGLQRRTKGRNLETFRKPVQGVYARSLQGNASNEKAKEMGALVQPMAEYAWSIAEGA